MKESEFGSFMVSWLPNQSSESEEHDKFRSQETRNNVGLFSADFEDDADFEGGSQETRNRI